MFQGVSRLLIYSVANTTKIIHILIFFSFVTRSSIYFYGVFYIFYEYLYLYRTIHTHTLTHIQECVQNNGNT